MALAFYGLNRICLGIDFFFFYFLSCFLFSELPGFVVWFLLLILKSFKVSSLEEGRKEGKEGIRLEKWNQSMRYKADGIYHFRHLTKIVLSLTKKQSPGKAISESSLKISPGYQSILQNLLCCLWVCLTDCLVKWVRRTVYSATWLTLPYSLQHNQVGLCPYPASSYTLSHLRPIMLSIVISSTQTLCNYLCYLCAFWISAFPTIYRLQEEPINSQQCLIHAKNPYFSKRIILFFIKERRVHTHT